MSPRLILPRDLAGANVIEVEPAIDVVRPEPADVAQHAADAPVVLVVPSLAVLLQAAWLEDLRAQGQQSFSDWWARVSGDSEPACGWRYDLVVSSWARAVGPERVHVIAGEDQAAASRLLEGVVVGAALAPEPWLRSLRAVEVRMLEELVEELLALGMVGRNAADLVHGAADAQRRTPAQGLPSLPPLDGVSAMSTRQLASEMEARLDALGVHVHGDRSALGWPAVQDAPPATVLLADSLTLTIGMLERVTSWGLVGEQVE